MIDEFLNLVPLFLENDVLVGLFFFAATAIIVALWIPGFLLPIAASSGALLNTWWGSAAVALGALVGSMAIFMATRHFGKHRTPASIVDFLAKFERQFVTHGAWYILLLRLVGAPHFFVSAGSALVPVRAPYFALATLGGMIPAIFLAAAAGASLVPT